jgi:hypothetical protein
VTLDYQITVHSPRKLLSQPTVKKSLEEKLIRLALKSCCGPIKDDTEGERANSYRNLLGKFHVGKDNIKIDLNQLSFVDIKWYGLPSAG